MEEQITNDQWNKLNSDQKNSFQEEVGKTFGEGETPSYDDILFFLGNNKLQKGDLSPLETPPTVEDIETIWKRVFSFLNG